MDVTPSMRAGASHARRMHARRGSASRHGGVLLAQPLAYRLNLAGGATLRLTTAQGPRSFPSPACSANTAMTAAACASGRAVYRRLWQDDSVSTLALYVAPGSDVMRSWPGCTRPRPGGRRCRWITPAQVRAISLAIFERTFIITRVLNWLAAGVAAVGLVSALLAWQLGRTRELALLRVVGLTRAGAALMIEAQTVFMGRGGAAGGAAGRLLTAVLLVRVINRRAFGWQIDLHLHPAQLTGAIALALTAALAAGLYPAWRTAHAPLVQDLREE